VTGHDIDTFHPLVSISTSFGKFYIPLYELNDALRTRKQWNFMSIFTTATTTLPLMSIESDLARSGQGTYISGLHCQSGSEGVLSHITVYDIKISDKYDSLILQIRLFAPFFNPKEKKYRTEITVTPTDTYMVNLINKLASIQRVFLYDSSTHENMAEIDVGTSCEMTVDKTVLDDFYKKNIPWKTVEVRSEKWYDRPREWFNDQSQT